MLRGVRRLRGLGRLGRLGRRLWHRRWRVLLYHRVTPLKCLWAFILFYCSVHAKDKNARYCVNFDLLILYDSAANLLVVDTKESEMCYASQVDRCGLKYPH